MLEKCKGRIKFEDVYFTYPTRQSVLNGISWTAEPGEIIALAGRSGCGKSTNVNFIYNSRAIVVILFKKNLYSETEIKFLMTLQVCFLIQRKNEF